MDRPRPARSPARHWPAVLGALLLAAALTGCGDLDAIGTIDDADWTSRFLYADDLDWRSNREMSRTSFDDRAALWANRGMMIVDVDVKSQGLGLEYALIAHENPDGRDWKMHVDLTSAEYHDLWTTYGQQGYRPLDIEGYLDDGQTRFAGVWIENVEELDWSSTRNMTSSDYGDYYAARSAEGLRPIDIEAYDTPSGLRFAAIWWENVDGLAVGQLRNIDRTRYQQEADDASANGFLMIDYERYETTSGSRYAAIWERPADRPGYQIRTNRDELGFANLWRTYRDRGYRLADFESDDLATDMYGGIWIETDARFRYGRKSTLDSQIQTYLDTYTVDDTGIETGISVAVIQDGEMIYRRGFGNADVAAGKVAHGETVYGFASVSKTIGGTLAALLEADTTLRDGTSYTLDMTERTDSYLTGIPSHHDHDVDHLASHLGCVPHYKTTPSIANQTAHYDTALAAAQSIWDTLLVTGCTVGSQRSYSTPAFTLLGAVLEEATGKTIVELLEDELFGPHGLGSFDVQFASGAQPSDYDRAVLYTRSGAPVGYPDNTWKVLGGGIEGSAVDLAEFGWRVLDGRVVDATTRDDRLWSTVDTSCTGTGTGTCENGLGWELRTIGGRRVAEHGGLQTGARSHVRVYRDDGLVIAILTNEAGHDAGSLATTIANTVLAP